MMGEFRLILPFFVYLKELFSRRKRGGRSAFGKKLPSRQKLMDLGGVGVSVP